MRHEWFDSWIKHLMKKGQLAIHIARDDDKLVAIAPLYIMTQIRKGIPLRILTFIQSGVTPRCNFILHNEINTNLFFDYILSSKEWNIMELRSIEKDTPLTNKFIDYLKTGHNFVIENGIQSPFEILDSDWKTYLLNKTKKYRRSIRMYSNRINKCDSYKILHVDNYDEFEKYFDTLIRISSQSWKAQVATDFKSMPQMAEFIKEFSKLGNNDKMFVLDILSIDEKAIAFSYYLRDRNRLVAIRWEYDEEYSYYSPGVILHNYCLEKLCDTGEKWEYDLTGEATAHKSKLLRNIRKHINITIGRPGFYGNILMFIKKILMKSNNGIDSPAI